jgi:multiple sugar transport system substrate-binding protein
MNTLGFKPKSGLSRAVTIAIIVVVVVALVSVLGYTLSRHISSSTPSSTLSTSSSPPSPVTLTLITFSDPANQWMQWAAQQFEAQHPGVTIKIVPESFSSYIQSEITAEKTGSSQYDILGFTSTSALSVEPYLVNLSQLITINQSDIPYSQLSFGGLYRNTTTGATEMIGVPYDSSTFALFYRTDIFDNKTLNQTFFSEYHVGLDPHDWTNWTQAIWADEFLVNQTHTTKYGILVDAQQQHDIIDTFPAIFGWWYARNQTLNGGTVGGLTNYNIMFYGSAPPGRPPLPSFNNSAGVQALETFYQLIKYDPVPFSEVNYGTIGTLFAQGNAAGAIMFTPENPTLVNSSIAGKYAVSTLPGGYAETGTDFLGVSKYSLHKQLAAEFIQFLVEPQINAQLYYMTGEFPISAQAAAQISSNTTLSAWQRQLVKTVYATAEVAWANPPNLPQTISQLIPDFNQQVYNFLLGDGSPQSAMQALNTAAAQWASVVDQ